MMMWVCIIVGERVVSVCVCGCAGVVPVTVRPPQAPNISTTLPTVHMIVEVSKAAAVLTTAYILRLLKSKVPTTVIVIQVL